MKNGLLRAACLLAAIAASGALATAQEVKVPVSVTVYDPNSGGQVKTTTTTCTSSGCTETTVISYVN